MRTLFSVFRSVRPILTYGFFGSIALVLLIEFKLKDMDPMLGWKHAFDGANLATNFLLSYIASYLFFFIGDHWERTRERGHIQPRVIERVKTILMYYSNTLVNMVSTKRCTKFSDRQINEIPRKEWPEFIRQVFWITEQSQQTTASYFEHFIYTWSGYGEQVREPAMDIVTKFESYDPRLTALLDVIHQMNRRLHALEQCTYVFSNTDRTERTANGGEMPALDSLVFQLTFAIHESIQHGIQLVALAEEIDDHVIHVQIQGIKRLLETKGEYMPESTDEWVAHAKENRKRKAVR